MKKLSKKVLLIGWDAADWKVITPLLDAGKMPNLQRLVENGVMGNLSTLYPILSPMLWTTIATGKRAHKHGIHGFSEPDPSSGGARPITNLGRTSKAIWNIANQNGLKSNVVGWWPSHPVEPINGVMISDHFQDTVGDLDQPWPMRPNTVHPPHLAESLAHYRVHPQELDVAQLLPFVPNAANIEQKEDKRLYSVAKVLAECASVHAAATATMQLEEWDFMAVYFDTIDHFCHGFMQYHPPRLPWIKEEDYEMYKDVVSTGYLFHDKMLGTYMELAPPDTTILICSDHGFHSDHLRPQELPNEPAGPADEHRHFGMFAAMGPGIQKDKLIFGASLLDITPTILALLGLPLGRDMDGRPLMDALDTDEAVDYIDSWEDVKGDDGCHPADMQVDPVDARAALKQLVELGYIEEVDEDIDVVAENTVKELRHNLARDLIDSNKHNEAIPIFQELWEANQGESRFGLKLFDCYLTLKQTPKAETTLALMRQRKIKYAEQAQTELTALQAIQKEKEKQTKEEALDEKDQRKLRKLSKQAATNASTFAYLSGRLLHAQGQHGEALIELEKAQKVQMHNRPSLWQEIGDVYLSMHRIEEAEKQFLRILEVDPINAQAHFGLARTYLAQRKAEKQALEAINASLGLVFHQPRGHYLRAVALHRLGRFQEAVSALQQALQQNAVYPAAHRRLARLSVILNKSEQAQQHFDLARAALKRIAQVKAGELAKPHHSAADLEPLSAAVTLGELGAIKKLPPITDQTITIVSGLPRSGTSMMMQMLKAGGLNLLTDEQRQADSDNPNGYFELENAKKTTTDWIGDAQGKVVKIVAQLLQNLPQQFHYRIIFMERPLNEVIASQAVMLERLGKKGSALSDRRLAQTYLQQAKKVRTILAAHPDKVSTLSIDYHKALTNPDNMAAILNDFFGGKLDEAAMIKAVVPQLRRQGA